MRNIGPGDETEVLRLIDESFHGLEYLPRVKAGIYSPYLNREGSFVAEQAGKIVGCICFTDLPHSRWFETRYLAVGNNDPVIASRLISKAEEYARSKKAERLKVYVPAVQPYVGLYTDAGFRPARRDVRVLWDLKRVGDQQVSNEFEIRDLDVSMADEASTVWGQGLSPYWDWWIEEQTGPESASSWVRDSVRKHDHWTGAFQGGKMIGNSLVEPDRYGKGDARFNGVYMLPEHRGRGVGSALMRAVIAKAQGLGQQTMRVYTMSYLEHLAPGVILYLKNGGGIEAEYLRLEKSYHE